jgi:hypothetical protein
MMNFEEGGFCHLPGLKYLVFDICPYSSLDDRHICGDGMGVGILVDS